MTVSPNFAIDCAPVTQALTAKSLGVTIDKNLTWEEHIKIISKKISAGISAIERIRSIVPVTPCYLHTMLLFSLIIAPLFGATVPRADNLQKLQNRAARIITFSSYDYNANELFGDLGWL